MSDWEVSRDGLHLSEGGHLTGMSYQDPLRLYSALLEGMLEGGEELFAAQEFLHTLIQTMSIPVFIKDRSSTFIGCNNAFAEYAGMTVSAVIGRSDSDMPWQDLSGADYVDWDRRVMNSGIESLGISEPMQLADGTLRWLETDKYPVIAKDGQVVGLLGSFRDVTDRVEAEMALQRLVGSLDQQVDQKTEELERTNDSLRGEMRERERLQIEEREQREKLEVLRDIAATLSSTLDLDAVLDKVVTGVQRLLFVDLISVVLADEEDDDFVVRRLDVTDGYNVPELMRSTEVLEWLLSDDGPGDQNGATCVVPIGHCFGPARSAIASVMVVGGRRVGYLMVESRAGHLASGFAIARLSAVAGQAAATMSTIRLSADAAGRAALQERERLAKDLHDTVIQAVSTISLLSEAARTLVDPNDPVAALIERMHDASVASQAEMRSLLLEMRTGELAKMSLRQLVETAIAVFSARSRVRVVADLEEVEVDDVRSIAVYRIVQEALNNVLRHANASAVSITLTSDPIAVRIRDDGDGFETNVASAGHLGVSIMSERAAAIGAVLTISSSRGAGTSVDLSLGAQPDDSGDVPEDDETVVDVQPVQVVDRLPVETQRIAPLVKSGRRRSPLLWVAVTVLSAAAFGVAFGASRSAGQSADVAQSAVNKGEVLQSRVLVVRPLLEELNLAVLQPYGLTTGADLEAAKSRSMVAISSAAQLLSNTSDMTGTAAEEAAHVRDILEDLAERPTPAGADYLFDVSGRAQFDGVPPTEQPPSELDSIAEVIWLDQVATFILHESIIARFPSLGEPPASTADTNEYLGSSVEAVRDEGGWLGPDVERPLDGGYMDTDVSSIHLAGILDSLNDVLGMSPLVVEDQWIRSLSTDPNSESPLPLSEVVAAEEAVVQELRALADTRLSTLMDDQRDAARSQGRRADILLILAVIAIVGAFLAAARTVVLLVAASRKLAHAARTDPLTGLGNRKVLETATVKHLSSQDLAQHALVTIDMDNFKLVNDLYGHGFGDHLLCVTAQGLGELVVGGLAAEATAVRLGGDEFLVSFHDTENIDTDRVRAELDRLRERLVSADDGTLVHPSFSYGLVVAVGSPDLATLMKSSDLAAYEEKAHRRTASVVEDAHLS